MLNLGMGEMFIFATITLVVLGPDKLPSALRACAKWYVKIKNTIQNVQRDIEQELNITELRTFMQDEISRLEQLEQKMQKHYAALQQLEDPIEEDTEKQIVSTTSYPIYTVVEQSPSMAMVYRPKKSHLQPHLNQTQLKIAV